MPYAPRPLTSQAVSAALKRAGFNRSEPTGLRDRTAGYKVRKSRVNPAYVEVSWLPDSRSITPDREHPRLMLLRCADQLLHAGFRSQLSEGAAKLTVYARTRA